MFSCYRYRKRTATCQNERQDMTNNPFGAEAEYILWGNDSVKEPAEHPCHDLWHPLCPERRVYAFSTDTTMCRL